MAEDPIAAAKLDHHHQRRRIRRRCFLLSSLSAAALIVLFLLLTLVFKIRDPIVTLNRITLDAPPSSAAASSAAASSAVASSNVSLTADVSVKNPNSFPFKFSGSNTAVYYRGVFVGDGHGPGGDAGARRTVRMNISMEVAMDKVFAAPGLAGDPDIGSGIFKMESYTKVPGKVNMVILKKDAVIEMNCTVKYNLTSQEIRGQDCKRRIIL